MKKRFGLGVIGIVMLVALFVIVGTQGAVASSCESNCGDIKNNTVNSCPSAKKLSREEKQIQKAIRQARNQMNKELRKMRKKIRKLVMKCQQIHSVSPCQETTLSCDQVVDLSGKCCIN